MYYILTKLFVEDDHESQSDITGTSLERIPSRMQFSSYKESERILCFVSNESEKTKGKKRERCLFLLENVRSEVHAKSHVLVLEFFHPCARLSKNVIHSLPQTPNTCSAIL